MLEKAKGDFMKKMIKKANWAMLGMLVSVPAFAAPAASGINMEGLCVLINQLKSVFNVLRTLAFVGAAFIIAGWAWGFISKGAGVDIEKDLKPKGIGMLVGFILLFTIGVVLQFLVSTTGAEVMGCVTSGW